MSERDAKVLITKLRSDSRLQRELNTALRATFAEVAEKQGLSCTMDEFNSAIKEISVNTVDSRTKGKIKENAIVAIVSVAVV